MEGGREGGWEREPIHLSECVGLEIGNTFILFRCEIKPRIRRRYEHTLNAESLGVVALYSKRQPRCCKLQSLQKKAKLSKKYESGIYLLEIQPESFISTRITLVSFKLNASPFSKFSNWKQNRSINMRLKFLLDGKQNR